MAHRLALIHVPKTGGHSRATAVATLRDLVLYEGHALTASHVPPGLRSFAVVRHPVERFRSAWAIIGNGRWNQDEDAMLAQLRRPTASNSRQLLLFPQVKWIDAPVTDLVPFEMWVPAFRNVCMQEDIPVGPIPVKNVTIPEKPDLSVGAYDTVLQHYAADYDLWQQAWLGASDARWAYGGYARG